MESVVEVFLGGIWVRAATLQTFGPESCRLDYLPEYLFGDNPVPIALGLPLSYNPDFAPAPDQVVDRRPPPFLYDLIPQGQGRRYLVKALCLVDSDQLVMPLINVGAFNPIGALRIRSAVDFFQEQAALNPRHSQFDGLELDDIRRRSNAFLEHIQLHAMLASGTTGVQGVAPKYLLAQDDQNRWYADLAISDQDVRAHWLVKLPRGSSAEDKAVLRNEIAYLRTAAACGLRTHHEPMMIDDMLFVRRFDRVVNPHGLHRLHQESLASVAGLRGFAPATSLNELVSAMRSVVSEPAAETLEFIKRDVLNLALRNTDNHARNTALQRTLDGTVQLTPLYDFGPMFMDPEIVPRSLHWREVGGPNAGRRIDGWEAVVESLALPDTERDALCASLHEFAETVGRLSTIARDHGVDPDVIEACRTSIDQQARELSSLAVSQREPERESESASPRPSAST